MPLANTIQSFTARVAQEFNTVRVEIANNASIVYTKTEVDNALDLKANTIYVDTGLGLKANQSTTYTKTEIDTITTQLTRGVDTVNVIASTDASVYADSSVQPMEDPQNRSGWHFKNAVAGQKINWYTYSNSALRSTHTRAALTSIWAIITIYDVRSRPFINIYSNRLGDGLDAASWYRSRWVLDQYPVAPVANTKYFLYFGTDPGLYSELPRLQITDTTDQFDRGPRNSAEVLSQMSWATNSAAQVNGENWTIHATGVTIAGEDVSSPFVHVGATQAALSSGLALKANTADVYTRTATDSAISTAVSPKANSADVYTKSEVYTKTETDTAISNGIAAVIDTAPGALNTLNELAAALGDDENFATTVSTQIGLKADQSTTYTKTEVDNLLSPITTELSDLGAIDLVALFETNLAG